MMPGLTCLPAASMTMAPAGAVSPLPTLVILPCSTRRSAFCSVPCDETVQTVAFFTSTAAGATFCCAETETQSAAAARMRFLRAVFTSHLRDFGFQQAAPRRRGHLGRRDPRAEAALEYIPRRRRKRG